MGEKRRSKSEKRQTAIRAVLAGNLIALRDRKYAELPTATKRNKKLAEDADMSTSNVQRIINQEQAASVDYVDFLAIALGVRPQDLLTPYFATGLSTKPTDIRSRRRRLPADAPSPI